MMIVIKAGIVEFGKRVTDLGGGTTENVDSPGGEAHVRTQLPDAVRRQRRCGGRLDDDRAAGGHGRTDLEREVEQREVPGDEGNGHADRLIHEPVAVRAVAIDKGLRPEARDLLGVEVKAVAERLEVFFRPGPVLSHLKAD